MAFFRPCLASWGLVTIPVRVMPPPACSSLSIVPVGRMILAVSMITAAACPLLMNRVAAMPLVL